MVRERTYTDEELTAAVSRCHSWRGVLRELRLSGTSSRAIGSVRAHADRLGLSYSHFQGQLRWRENELRTALSSAGEWSEALERLRLQPGSEATLKGHAVRFGIDFAHLDKGSPPASTTEHHPDERNLRRAGPLLAAAWFTLCGYEVSWPLEPHAMTFSLTVMRASDVSR